MLEYWLAGIESALQWYNLFLVVGGVFIGLSFASIPGLNNTTAMILMVPFVYDMDVIPAVIFMVSIYGGGIHGGCILAILFRIPGEAQSACTTFDGYPMGQQGKAADAMGIAFLYSTLGGLVGVIVCIVFAPIISDIALSFGPAEFFAFIFFGLVVASSAGTKAVLPGLIAGCIGLMISTVGVCPSTAIFRYTFGTDILAMGIEFIPIIMGVFAINELLKMVLEGTVDQKVEQNMKFMCKLPSYSFFRKTFKTFMRSAAIGTAVGIMPGAGATAASFISYGIEVKHSDHPERYGKGEPKGVIASETANNASFGGAMMPMLTLGIPGSTGTAVILSIMVLKGITPSPLVFNQMPDLIYAVFCVLILINVVMLVESLIFGGLYANMLKLPRGLLCFIILVFCTVGTFSIRSSMEDLWIMLIFGVIGYIFEKFEFPIASLVLGSILGTMAETSFVQSMEIQGSFDLFVVFKSPISCTFMVFTLLFLLFPVIKEVKFLLGRGSDPAHNG